MRIVVTGRHGQAATALAERSAHHPGLDVLTLGRPGLDLERPETIGTVIAEAKPDLVVNAAAYTAVDKAEAEPDRAFAVNRDGAAAVARAAARLGVPLILLSTDYVFDGSKPAPYVEADETSPLGVYGHSKREGEQAVLAAHHGALVFRTSWVFSPFGANFVKTMLRLAKEREVLRIVDDQSGNPTAALDLAEMILSLAPQLSGGAAPGGVYHLANAGSTTWCGFARFIFAESAKRGGPAPRVEAITTVDYPTPARRPANSRLDTTAFTRRFGLTPRPWQEAAAETVARLLA